MLSNLWLRTSGGRDGLLAFHISYLPLLLHLPWQCVYSLNQPPMQKLVYSLLDAAYKLGNLQGEPGRGEHKDFL